MAFRRSVLATLLAMPVAALAQSAPSVEQPWMRAAGQGATGGAFMTLRNAGGQPDRLLSASSPAARAVELHATMRDGDVMRMRPVQAIEVPAGGSVTLQPGGLHVMLIGLVNAAEPGATVPLILNFERGGPVQVRLPVLPAGARGPG